MRLHITAAVALAIGLSAAPEAASAFDGQLGIYRLNEPAGWTARKDQYSDMNWDAPGGMSYGGMFAGLKDATRSLDGEIDNFIASASGTLIDRRTVTIDGKSCRAATVQTSGRARNTMLLCHFMVPFSDGPANIEFFFALVSPVETADAQLQTFWSVANTITWGDNFAPAP